MEEHYISLRNQYLPTNIKTVFVLESPPAGHGYFYDAKGRTSEVLFRSFMKAVLNFSPEDKEEGLKKLAEEGYVLINPIYTPVNKLPDKEADNLILENYEDFKKDLLNVIKDKKTPVVLVKSNILRLLEEPLLKDGFNVLNRGVLVPFPLHYHYPLFKERVRKMLSL